MQTLILFLKGIVIGFGKVIPGVSGSLLAISMGVYETALFFLLNLWKKKREAICYLGPIGCGILVSILFGSGILLHFLNTYYVFTVALFIGLILGTVPDIVRKEQISSKDWFFVFGILVFFFFLERFFSFPKFVFDGTFFSHSFVFFLGIIDAVTMVLPGISGTATYMMLGSYEYILSLFSNPFQNLFSTFLFGLGLIVGVFFMIQLVNYAFSKHKHTTWICIIGFLFSSLFSLLLKIIDSIHHANLLSILILVFIGYSITNFFSSTES